MCNYSPSEIHSEMTGERRKSKRSFLSFYNVKESQYSLPGLLSDHSERPQQLSIWLKNPIKHFFFLHENMSKPTSNSTYNTCITDQPLSSTRKESRSIQKGSHAIYFSGHRHCKAKLNLDKSSAKVHNVIEMNFSLARTLLFIRFTFPFFSCLQMISKTKLCTANVQCLYDFVFTLHHTPKHIGLSRSSPSEYSKTTTRGVYLRRRLRTKHHLSNDEMEFSADPLQQIFTPKTISDDDEPPRTSKLRSEEVVGNLPKIFSEKDLVSYSVSSKLDTARTSVCTKS
jgi:hypothetical protein